MERILKYKNYSVKELKELLGNDWQTKVGLLKNPVLKNKPIIYHVDDFDLETKTIYFNILSILKEYNTDKFNFWATGSRVKGNWKTKEESEEIALKYNTKVKYLSLIHI